MPMLSKVVAVLAFFTRLAESLMAKAKAKKAQGEMDALEDNPSGWFRGYFSNSLHIHDDGQTTKTDTDNH
jgi:hypothetical protein